MEDELDMLIFEQVLTDAETAASGMERYWEQERALRAGKVRSAVAWKNFGELDWEKAHKMYDEAPLLVQLSVKE